MHEVAQNEYSRRGIWKIGNAHVHDILNDPGPDDLKYNLIEMDSYRDHFLQWLGEE